jgi:hypothetical protein
LVDPVSVHERLKDGSEELGSMGFGSCFWHGCIWIRDDLVWIGI